MKYEALREQAEIDTTAQQVEALAKNEPDILPDSSLRHVLFALGDRCHNLSCSMQGMAADRDAEEASSIATDLWNAAMLASPEENTGKPDNSARIAELKAALNEADKQVASAEMTLEVSQANRNEILEEIATLQDK